MLRAPSARIARYEFIRGINPRSGSEVEAAECSAASLESKGRVPPAMGWANSGRMIATTAHEIAGHRVRALSSQITPAAVRTELKDAQH